MIPYKTLAVIGVIAIFIIAIYPTGTDERDERTIGFIETTHFTEIDAIVTWETTLNDITVPKIKFNVPGEYIVEWSFFGEQANQRGTIIKETIDIPISNSQYVFSDEVSILSIFPIIGECVSIENTGTGVIEVHEVRIR